MSNVYRFMRYISKIVENVNFFSIESITHDLNKNAHFIFENIIHQNIICNQHVVSKNIIFNQHVIANTVRKKSTSIVFKFRNRTVERRSFLRQIQQQSVTLNVHEQKKIIIRKNKFN